MFVMFLYFWVLVLFGFLGYALFKHGKTQGEWMGFTFYCFAVVIVVVEGIRGAV
jgi:hypothetical protein